MTKAQLITQNRDSGKPQLITQNRESGKPLPQAGTDYRHKNNNNNNNNGSVGGQPCKVSAAQMVRCDLLFIHLFFQIVAGLTDGYNCRVGKPLIFLL